MGSTVVSCCGESMPSHGLKTKKSICDIEKHRRDQRSDEIKTSDEKNPWEEKNGQLVLSDQYILRLLGQIIPIENEKTIEEFEIEGIIGTGAFGIVYLAQLKANIKEGKTEKYAVKRIAKELLIQKCLVNNVKDERDILAMCDNKFLVSLILAFQDSWYLYLVMEYAIGGDTYSLVANDSFKLNLYKSLGENAVRFIAGSVILALECLHKNGYMYRDLKPENVLIFEDGSVKLTDFGLVKKSLENKKSETISGTEFYYAPEMILKKGYDKEVDYWTLGIYLYELSNYEPPFTEEDMTKARFEKACIEAETNREWLNPNVSFELKDLINRLLRYDVSERLGSKEGWKEVKNHSFFKDFNWDDLYQGKIPSPLLKIVDMFPPSVKPFKEEPRSTEVVQQRFEGWSLVKKKTM